MLFTTPAILALLSGTFAVAAPTAEPGNKVWGDKQKYKDDCKKDWDNKWKNDEWKKSEKLFYFDAEYYVMATPDQVVNNVSVPTPGQPGAKGIFKYGINIAENTICYNITLSGVTGNYSSPAITATHVHEGAKGRAGPPRLVSFMHSNILLYVELTITRLSPTHLDLMSAAPHTAA